MNIKGLLMLSLVLIFGVLDAQAAAGLVEGSIVATDDFAQGLKKLYPDINVSYDSLGNMIIDGKGANVDKFLGYLSTRAELGKLRTFKIGNVSFAFDNLANILSEASGVQKLELSNLDLKSGLAKLAPAIARMQNLQELKLSGNEVTGPALLNFVNAINDSGAKRFPSLRCLQITSNKVVGMSSQGWTALRRLLSFTPNLQVFEFVNNAGGKGLAELAPAIAKMHSLQKLDLSGNGVTVSTIIKFANSLQRNGCTGLTDLRELHFGDNKLDLNSRIDGDINAFELLLSFTPNLQMLDLGLNPLGERIEKLAPTIARISKLQTLNLRNIGISENAVINFVTDLCQWRTKLGVESPLKLTLYGDSFDGAKRVLDARKLNIVVVGSQSSESAVLTRSIV